MKKKKLINKMIINDIKNNKLFYKIKIDSLSLLSLDNPGNFSLETDRYSKEIQIKKYFEYNKHDIIKKGRIKLLFHFLNYIIKYIDSNELLEYFFINIYFDKDKIFYAEILICIKSLIEHSNRFINDYLVNCSPSGVASCPKPNSIIYYLDNKKSIFKFFNKKKYRSKILRINKFNTKKNILNKLEIVKKASIKSLINFWIIYMIYNKLYCKDNKLYKRDEEGQLVYYKNISHLRKDIKNIYKYIMKSNIDDMGKIIDKKKDIRFENQLPDLFRFIKIVTIYIGKAYKVIKKNNDILNIQN